MSFEPQPTLAWQFESSNVESIQGLVPRAQVSPGPAQLLGSAALITNAPNAGDAVYFPGTTGSYMSLGTTSPVNVNVRTSNLFVEAWVYPLNTSVTHAIIATGGGSQNWLLSISAGSSVPSLYVNCFPGASAGGSFTGGTAPVGTYTHIAFSWALGPTSNTLSGFVNGVQSFQQVITRGIFYTSSIESVIGNLGGSTYANMYIRDLRVVKGGIVPTASFPLTLYPDPFAYTLPSYVSGTGGTVVFTMLGQFVTYPAGKFNKCLRLNNGTSGLNSSIEYSSLASTLNNFSIAAWVYPYSVNTARTNTFFEMKPLVTTGTQFQVSAATTGKSTVAVTTNGGSLTELNSVANLTLGKWTHHCLTFSNVGATIVGNVFASYYINGTLQTSSNATTQATGLLSNLTMGSTTTASADTGLDDFRVYDRALTSAEAASVYLSFGDPAGPKTYAAGVSSNVTTDGDGFTTHTFTTPGTFTCLRPGVADVLVVAGGGAGGALSGGGGGGGGVQYFPNYYINQGTYPVTVGTGGKGVPTGIAPNGTPSQFNTISAIGGGSGGSTNFGVFGGSGGGGGSSTRTGFPGAFTQGYGGGAAGPGGATGGGGGGARQTGGNWTSLGPTSNIGGYGGVGISFDNGITYYGGGGGGANLNLPGSLGGPGGTGGGGTGMSTTFTPIRNGTPGTGGGGGGGGPGAGGSGGPGIVMIRYLTQGAPQGYETVYTGETTIGTFSGYNSPTANVQVFHGASVPGHLTVSAPTAATYTWVKPTTGTFARIECVGGGGGGYLTKGVATSQAIALRVTSTSNVQINDTLTGPQMSAIGISYPGPTTTFTTGNVVTAIQSNYIVITTTGTNLNLAYTPTPGVAIGTTGPGSVLRSTSNSNGVTDGTYNMGTGGSGAGYVFATLPLSELPSTVNLSVGGGGAGYPGSGFTPSALGVASTFGPYVSPSTGLAVSVTTGATPNAGATAGGGNGVSFPNVSNSILVGGNGVPLTISPALNYATIASYYSAYGGSGGGNGLVPGFTSLFAGPGGDGTPQTGTVPGQDGGYPGGGGGGGGGQITSLRAGGRGGAGRIRIIVY